MSGSRLWRRLTGQNQDEDHGRVRAPDDQDRLGNAAIQEQIAAGELERREASTRSGLGSSTQAIEALDGMLGNEHYQAVRPNQRSDMLEQFAATPNAATASYLQGAASLQYQYNTPDIVAAAEDMMRPDSGRLGVDGNDYTIENGQLLDGDGQVVGSIDNMGSYTIGDGEAQSVYDDINARVQLIEGEGEDAETLLNLHAADPHDKLGHENMYDGTVDRMNDTLLQMRREGLDPRVTSTFRSNAEQDALYAKGRTASGNIVTNARGGQSWHNYGAAVDIAFNDGPRSVTWNGNWDRYGEIAQDNGMTWGGAWDGFSDRPHVEYHPGYAATGASSLRGTGLDEVHRRFDNNS